MGFFSKACENGIRAVIYLAQHATVDNKRVLKEIAEATDSPEAFMAKILQELTKGKLISSVKGPYGGFYISDDQLATLNLRDVVEIIDGNEVFTQCALGLKACSSDKPCPLHQEMVAVRSALAGILTKTKLMDLQNLDDLPGTFLKFS